MPEGSGVLFLPVSIYIYTPPPRASWGVRAVQGLAVAGDEQAVTVGAAHEGVGLLSQKALELFHEQLTSQLVLL